MGQSPPGDTYNENGIGTPFFQGVKDFTNRYPKNRVFCTASTRFAKAGDILFSVRAPIGEINRAKESCSIGRGLAAIRGQNKYETDYLEYALRSIKHEWGIFESQGAVFGNAKKSDLENLLVPWPPESYRVAIAHILGALDDQIETLRRMNETLEGIARALFKAWFVDFEPVRAKMSGRWQRGQSLPGLPADLYDLFPDTLIPSELGQIPQGWRVSTIGDDFNLTMGQSPPGSSYNEAGDGLPFFQGCKDFGFRYPITRVFCTMPKRLAKPGDTLVSVRAPVGDVNMAKEKCIIGRGVAALRHKSGSRSYTYYAMLHLRQRFQKFEDDGTVFGAISSKQFQSLIWYVAPSALVTEFETRASPLDERIAQNTEQSRTLAALRDALLPELISGRLRLADAERFLQARGL
jgi:type I restriction enzyme S subunit